MRRVLWVAAFFAAVLAFAPDVFAEDSLALKWQLPQGARYSYDYSQEMTMEMDGKDVPQEVGNTVVKAEGPLVINCNGNGAVVKYDMRPTQMTVAGREMPPEQMQVAAKSIEMPMDADGNMSRGYYSAGGDMQPQFDMMFPLPQGPLDTINATTQDFVVSGSGLVPNLKGKAVYTFTGLKTVEGMDCVAYHVTCKLKTEKQKQKQKDSKSIESASFVYEYDCLFARDRGFFVSVDGDTTVTVAMDFKNKEHPMKMSMVQHHKTSLMLTAAEYNVAPAEPAAEAVNNADIETADTPDGGNTGE